MWLFTEFGFFSITRSRREDSANLQVRARSRKDLERLLVRHEEKMRNRHHETPGSLPFKRPDIIETTDSDYRFRIILPDSEVALILLDEAMRIHYTNFKNRVAEVLGHVRARDLHDVWSTMFQVQLREHGRRGFQFDPDFEVRGEGDIIDAEFEAPENS